MNEPHLESTVPSSLVRPTARYVALLVLAATFVLTVGALLRPKSQQPAVQANELATLPELSQRRMLRDMTTYLAERAAAFATSVVYLPSADASGLVVGRDSILSALVGGDGAPGSEEFPTLVLVSSTRDVDSIPPAARVIGLDTLTSRWVLVVGRTEHQRPLSLSGLTGGLMPVQCGGVALQEILLDAVVPLELRGAGVFDLDGNALALAVPCNSRIALVPIPDAPRALEQQQTPEYQLWSRHGLRVTATDSASRRLLDVRSGLLVTEVLVGGPADRAGLWPGDAINTAAAQSVSQPSRLGAILDSTEAVRLEVRRAGRTRTLVLHRFSAAAAPGYASTTTLASIAPADLTATSRAARAGLHPGDRVLQLNRLRSLTAASVSRALAGTDSLFLVYQRGRHRRSLVLP